MRTRRIRRAIGTANIISTLLSTSIAATISIVLIKIMLLASPKEVEYTYEYREGQAKKQGEEREKLTAPARIVWHQFMEHRLGKRKNTEPSLNLCRFLQVQHEALLKIHNFHE